MTVDVVVAAVLAIFVLALYCLTSRSDGVDELDGRHGRDQNGNHEG